MENGKICDCCGEARDTKHRMNGFDICKFCYLTGAEMIMANIKHNQQKKLSERVGGMPF